MSDFRQTTYWLAGISLIVFFAFQFYFIGSDFIQLDKDHESSYFIGEELESGVAASISLLVLIFILFLRRSDLNLNTLGLIISTISIWIIPQLIKSLFILSELGYFQNGTYTIPSKWSDPSSFIQDKFLSIPFYATLFIFGIIGILISRKESHSSISSTSA